MILKRTVLIGLLGLLITLPMIFPQTADTAVGASTYNSGDTAWMLTATALVLLMTPGLAFFYGGMVSTRNILSTMMQSLICMMVVTVIWVIFGFSLAFGNSWNGFVGNPGTYFLMRHTTAGSSWPTAPTIPLLLFAMFQLKFAVITPALITGAFAERIRFTSYLLFITLFIICVYCPLAHMVWHPDGILMKAGVLDFAGGTVVHMSAGWAALASALRLKKRNVQSHTPSQIGYVVLGTGLLWFGWFGFNAGSAFSAGPLAAISLGTTTTASAAAGLAWVFIEMIKGGKPSVMGACIGAVVGLVAITPAAGYVSIAHAMVIGIVAAIVSSLMVYWRSKSGIDDTLDVFPCHGVGGMTGMILTAVFADQTINPANTTGNGLLYGNAHILIIHLLAMVAVSAFSFVGSCLLLRFTNLILPLRVSDEDEEVGLDLSQHGEQIA